MNHDNLHTDNLLCQQLAAGDPEAFRTLYDQFAPRVFSTVLLYTSDQHLAEDVVQQVFTSCWEKREQFTSVTSLKDYLFIIARNRIFDELKKLSNQHRLLQRYRNTPDAFELSGEDILQQKQYRQLVEEAIEQLPAQQQQVFRLHLSQSLSYDEIAGLLNLSRLTIKKHLELARKSVRTYLRTRLPDDALITGYFIIAFGVY